ncbi:MAG TPA: SMI1/KNR4 family protein [Gemmataceae bacterium]|nr:SMI1/KNR4 family protein [Gemmataceae bacterium]
MPSQEQIDALSDAAEAGDISRLIALLDAGVPIDGRHKWGKTALWAAAQRGQAEAFFFLLGRGADANVRHTSQSWTPLQDAVGHGDARTADRERIFQALLASGLGKDPAAVQGAMLAAACSGTPAIVRGLIEAGADVRHKESAGGGYLLSAVVYNDRRDDVVPILVAAGADLTVRRPRSKYDGAEDKKLVGKTALEIAERLGHRKTAELIRAAGGAEAPKSAKKKATNSSVPKSWDRIEAWLKAHAPHWKPLLRGASAAQIAKAEEKLGLKLPADVRASFRRHNGTDDHGFFPDHAGDNVSWYMLPLSAMAGEAAEWAEMLDDGDFDDSNPKAARGVRKEAWNKKWVPFAGNGAGDNWCLDFAPATGGVKAQVIYVSHEMAPRERLAKSFVAWLSAFADDLEGGAYRYQEGEGLVPT